MSLSDLEPWRPDQFHFTTSLTSLKFSTTIAKVLCSVSSLFLTTPISTVLLYNPTVTQLASMFPACYESSGFITKGTRSLHYYPPWSDEFSTDHTTLLTIHFNITLHIRLGRNIMCHSHLYDMCYMSRWSYLLWSDHAKNTISATNYTI